MDVHSENIAIRLLSSSGLFCLLHLHLVYYYQRQNTRLWTTGLVQYRYFIILHPYSSNHLCGVVWFLPLFHNSFSCAGERFSIVVGVKARSRLQNLLRSAFLYIEKHMSSLWTPHKTLQAKFLGVSTDLWEVFNTALGAWEKLNWSLFQRSFTNKTYLHLNCVQQGLGSLQQDYPIPSV